MKKILALCLALMLMATMAVSVAAEISPEAEIIPDSGENQSPVSPQTGDMMWIVVAGVVVASLTTATVAAKKLTAND